MSFLTKKMINKLFNQKKCDDFNDKQEFVRMLIQCGGFECKCWMDCVKFNNEFKPRWNKLYERYIAHEKLEIIVFDSNDKEHIMFIVKNPESSPMGSIETVESADEYVY